MCRDGDRSHGIQTGQGQSMCRQEALCGVGMQGASPGGKLILGLLDWLGKAPSRDPEDRGYSRTSWSALCMGEASGASRMFGCLHLASGLGESPWG